MSVKPKDTEALATYLKLSFPDLPPHTPIMVMVRLLVRRGLPQGSPLSPFLAGALIAHCWNQAVSKDDAVMLFWHDDLNVGAVTKAKLTSVKELATSYFNALPAGPLEFHESEVLPAKSGKVKVLGYLIEPENGHIIREDGTRSTHVKPALIRFQRYKNKVFERLAELSEDNNQKSNILKYHKNFFASMQAWTKVGQYSFNLSYLKTILYIAEFNSKKLKI